MYSLVTLLFMGSSNRKRTGVSEGCCCTEHGSGVEIEPLRQVFEQNRVESLENIVF